MRVAGRAAAAWASLLLSASPLCCHCFEYYPEQRIESARLFGNMNKYAYYFTDLLVGQPTAQRASVIVDTGSRLVGFPCSDCEHCGTHLDPAFDFRSSQSARWFNCSESCTETCSQDKCPYRETYAEGSTISGFWFEDAVRLGDSLDENPPARLRLGCHSSENKLFYSQRANGIMGLAPSTGSMRQPTVLQQMFWDKEHVNKKVFSLCLATWGGRMTVGGYNSSYHLGGQSDDAIQWIDMRATHYYFVSPEGIMLIDDDDAVEVSRGSTDFGVTIVDSGTTYTYLPEALFSSLKRHLDDYCGRHDGCGADLEGDRCWRLRDPTSGPEQFPPLAIHFGAGVHISWMPENYLQQRGDEALWCRTFMQNSIFQTVLGISVMLHKDFIFDIDRGRLGVADARCPEYYEQPSGDEPDFQQKFSPEQLAPAAPRLGGSMAGVVLAASDERPELSEREHPSASRPSRTRAPRLLKLIPVPVRAAVAIAALSGAAALAGLWAARVRRRAPAALGTEEDSPLVKTPSYREMDSP